MTIDSLWQFQNISIRHWLASTSSSRFYFVTGSTVTLFFLSPIQLPSSLASTSESISHYLVTNVLSFILLVALPFTIYYFQHILSHSEPSPFGRRRPTALFQLQNSALRSHTAHFVTSIRPVSVDQIQEILRFPAQNWTPLPFLSCVMYFSPFPFSLKVTANPIHVQQVLDIIGDSSFAAKHFSAQISFKQECYEIASCIARRKCSKN